MNRTKNFLYNTIFTAGLQLITLLCGFVLPKLMLTYYGSEINGLVTSITQFITYLSLIEAGLASAAVYALYKPLAENDQISINSIVSASRQFYNKTGFIFIGLIAILSILYPLMVTSKDLSYLDIGLLVIALGGNGVLEFFTMSRYRVLLTADQKLYVISFASTISIILNVIIVGVLAALKTNIVILKFIALSAILVRSFILNIYVKKKYKNINFKATPDKTALNKRWDALYLQVLGAVHTGAPIIIGTFILSLKEVSVYSIYNMVVAGIGAILSIFVSGLSSSFGDVIIRKQNEILKKSYTQFEFVYYKIISYFYSCCIILIIPFVLLYTKNITDISYNMPLFGILLTLNGLFYNLKTPQGMMVISAGMFKETRLQTTIQGAIAVICSSVFAYYFGLIGLAIGMIISNAYRCIDLYIFCPKFITHTQTSSTLKQVILLFISMVIICLPFYFIKLNISSYGLWIMWAFIVSIYAIVIIIIISLLFDKKLTKDVLKRIFIIFKHSSKNKENQNELL